MMRERLLYYDRDYQYRDCFVIKYEWDNAKKELAIFCNYQARESIKITMCDVREYFALEILPNHVIDYIIPTFDYEKEADCYEIHLKQLYEVAKVWAKGMRRS